MPTILCLFHRKMAPSCSGLLKLNGVRLALFAVFITVNVTLYAQSKNAIMETFFRQVSSNRSDKVIENSNKESYRRYSEFEPGMKFPNRSRKAQRLRLAHKSYETLARERSFLLDPIVNPHDFRYVITPNVSCSDRDIELMICVVISSDNHEGRRVIRKTWGSYAGDLKNNAALVFFIGQNERKIRGERLHKSDGQSKIKEESLIYGDILQEDYIDSYQNLSLKSVSILKWVSLFCSNTKFVLKVDDDMYVNIPFLVKILRLRASSIYAPSAFVMGSLQVDAHPIRNPSSKWYTPESMFPEGTYPRYVSGTSYALTSEAAFLLYQASLRVPPFWLEDIYITGMCSKKASVDIYDSSYFSFGKPEVSGCSFREHVSGHRYTNEEILQIHRELYDPRLRC